MEGGCDKMATKSILKTIHIKSPKSASRLVSALENASGKSSKAVEMTRTASDASQKDECNWPAEKKNDRIQAHKFEINA